MRHLTAALPLVLLVPGAAHAIEPSWSAGTVIDTSTSVYYPQAGDLDGDGDLDIVIADRGPNRVRLLLNDGTGAFTASTIISNVTNTSGIALADMDVDGDLDIVSTSAGVAVAWYANDGSAAGWTRTIIDLFALTDARDVAVADLDSDGDADVAVTDLDGDQVVWFANLDGLGGLWSAAQGVDTVLDGANRVSAADIDLDGDVDLLASGFFEDELRLYTNDGAGSFTSTLVSSLNGAQDLAAFDVDRDGDRDIVHSAAVAGDLVWYESPAGSVHGIDLGAGGATDFELHDLDHDGDLDVLIALNTADDVRWYENLDGVGGSWAMGLIDGNLSNVNRLTAGDFDGDGFLDVVASAFGSGDTKLYLGQAPHGSTQGFTTSLGPTLNDPRHTTAADLDADGDLDFVGGGLGGLIVGTNDGTGAFTSTVLTTTSNWWCTAAGDLDGDGDVDVFAARNNTEASWWSNDGGGAWTGPTALLTTGVGFCRDAATADLDRDGDTDIVFTENNEVNVLLNDGAGTFTASVAATAFGAYSVEIIDFNRDGSLDLLVGADSGGRVDLVLGDGSGTGWTASQVASVSNPRGVDAVDADRDGDIDFFVVTDAGDTWLYTNAGDDVTFTPTSVDTGGASGWQLDAADVDLDGDVDVLTSTGTTLRLLENDGAGTYTASTVGTGSNMLHGAIGDFDLDGLVDVLVPHLSSGDRWFLHANDWFQAELTATDLAPAGAVTGSQEVVLQRWDLAHLGRTGDVGLSLSMADLTFTDASGAALTTADITSVAAAITVYLDDGDLAFSSVTDTVMVSDSTLTANVAGTVSLTFAVEAAVAAAGASTVWVVLETDTNASTAGLPTLVVEGPAAPFLYDTAGQGEAILDLVDATSTVTIGQAPTADAGGPYTGDEGVAVSVSGSNSSDPDGTLVAYDWDCDGDGTYDASGVAASCTFGDDGTYTVTLQVTDSDGLTDTASAPVIVANVAPVPSISGPTTGNEGDLGFFSGVGADVAADVVTLTWQVTNPSGVSVPPGPGPGAFAIYTDDGTWTIQLTATDDDGGTASISQSVSVANLPPTITSSAPTAAVEGTAWTYAPTATDPGVDALAWSLSGAPAGMTVDASSGALAWTPAWTDAGGVSFTLTVDDGDGGTDTESVALTVTFLDADGDGLADTWETDNGLDPTVDDSAADPDADGLSNLDEFLAGSDPNVFGGPGVATLDAPVAGAEVDTATPVLSWTDAVDPDGDALTYEVEVYEDAGMAVLLDAVSELARGSHGVTDWTPGVPVAENALGWWRVRASDPHVAGAWTALESFFVNSVEEAPSAPSPASPLAGDSVDTLTPELTWTAATDPDGDAVTYHVEVLAADGVTAITGASRLTGLAWTVDLELAEDTDYAWRVSATDDEGLSSAWSTPQEFFVDTTNSAPADIAWVSPEQDAQLEDTAPTLEVTASSDAEGEALTYVFELDTVESFDSAALLSGAAAAPTWDLAADGLSLDENRTWFARARVDDARGAASAWAPLSVFVRGPNDGPDAPALVAPQDGDALLEGDPAPTFSAAHATDPEGDAVTYGFVLARDEALTDVVAEIADLAAGAGPDGTADQTSWQPDLELEAGTYWWTATATDDRGATTRADAARSLVVDGPTGCDCEASVAGGGGGWGRLLILGALLGARRRRR